MNDKMKKVIARRNGKSYANMVANPPRKKKYLYLKSFKKCLKIVIKKCLKIVIKKCLKIVI